MYYVLYVMWVRFFPLLHCPKNQYWSLRKMYKWEGLHIREKLGKHSKYVLHSFSRVAVTQQWCRRDGQLHPPIHLPLSESIAKHNHQMGGWYSLALFHTFLLARWTQWHWIKGLYFLAFFIDSFGQLTKLWPMSHEQWETNNVYINLLYFESLSYSWT